MSVTALRAAPPAAAPAPAPDFEALLDRAQALARRFADDAAALDASAAAPARQIDALQQAGLLALTVSRGDGGHGAGLAQARAVVSALAQGEPSTALILAMHYNQQASIARNTGFWPEALARRLAREAAQAPALINAAQVEPELGSPSFGGLPATRARRTPEGWRLGGHKLYVTGAPLLRWISVLALTDEPEPRVGQFIVARDAPGVTIVPTWDPIGMRATVSHDVVFADAPVALDDVAGLRPAQLGVLRDEQTMAWYFNLASSVYDGVARAARSWLLGFLNHRRPGALGAPLASLATVQEAVGEIELMLATNDWLLRTHAQAWDAGAVAPADSAAVKHTVMDNAVRAVDRALDLAGNHGLARRNPLERHHRDVLCARIHAPPNALIRGNAGRAALQAALAAPAPPSPPAPGTSP